MTALIVATVDQQSGLFWRWKDQTEQQACWKDQYDWMAQITVYICGVSVDVLGEGHQLDHGSSCLNW